MAFYIWLLIGILLIGAELFVPGVILVFFGGGSILVALLTLVFPMSFSLQILIMLIVSVVSLILFRKKLLGKFTTKDKKIEFDSIVGEKVIVTQPIKPGLTGKVELHGSNWNAEAQREDLEIPEGTWVIVRGRKNLVLIVEPVKKNH